MPEVPVQHRLGADLDLGDLAVRAVVLVDDFDRTPIERLPKRFSISSTLRHTSGAVAFGQPRLPDDLVLGEGLLGANREVEVEFAGRVRPRSRAPGSSA